MSTPRHTPNPFAIAALALSAGLTVLPAHADTHAFDVYARENSLANVTHDATPLDTGLTFAVGDALAVTATGLWNGGGCGDFTADGTTCFGIDPQTGINYFALIGRIGSGAWFKLGTSYTGTAVTDGELFLAYDDSDSFNNSGFVTATVTGGALASAVPEPASLALMLGGLALAGAGLRRRSR